MKGPSAPCLSGLVGMVCLVLCLLTPGCVGLGVEKTYTEVFSNPGIAPDGLRIVDAGQNADETCTAAWLEAHRGQPSRIRPGGTEHGDAVWTYREGLLWNGVTLFVGIPVPLEVPTGSGGWAFVVREGRVTHATRKWSHYVGGIAGFKVGPCGWGPFGVHSLNPESPSF